MTNSGGLLEPVLVTGNYHINRYPNIFICEHKMAVEQAVEPAALIINAFGYSINLATVLVALLIIGVVYGIYKVQSSTRLDFADMVTRDGSKVSLSKFLQLIGGLACTWFILKTGLNGTLSEGIFGIYLTFIASIEGFSKFMTAKYNYSETSVRDAKSHDGDDESVQESLKEAATSAGEAALNAREAQTTVKNIASDLK